MLYRPSSHVPRCAARSPRRAFTLVEIMAVVIIIGVLATMVVTKISSHIINTRRDSTMTTINTVQTALESFAARADRYPTTEEGLRSLVRKPADLNGEEWTGPYLNDLPVDGWKQLLIYRTPGRNDAEYDLFSAGRDKKPETADDLRIIRRIDAEDSGSPTN